ncbi:hypothetical protein LTR27_005865 [Elasticomyces elasticus]|nr:hypothetical protein LTR27_005865 [Elasticomyces elasticus]
MKRLVATDWTMLVGLAMAVAQAGLMTLAVDRGLGQRTSDLGPEQLEESSKAFYAANILTVAVLAAAKMSVTLLIVSIQPIGAVLISCYAHLVVVGVWCVAGIFALAFQCKLPNPWALGSDSIDVCVDQFAIQVGLGVVSVVTDLAVVLLAFLMIQGVQTNFQRKLAVVTLFGTRLAIVPSTICALVTYHTYYFTSPQDRTWHAVAPVIWTQVTLNMSIITACIPSIKRFFMDVQSGLMAVTISEQYEMTHSGGKAAEMQSSSGLSVGSRLASKFGISSRRSRALSRTEISQQGEARGPFASIAEGQSSNTAWVRGGAAKREEPETESVKGLTDNAIHQTIDYAVVFEERESEDTPSRSKDADLSA